MQTRSMTKRAGVPHDLEAFNSYAQWEEDDDEDSFEPPQMPTCEEVPDEIKAAYDPNHFCPSWVKCCEDNLARKTALPSPIRWCETLPTFRTRFTRSQWRLYIGEICYNISYEHANQHQLTTEEYAAAHDYMHGKL